MKHSFKTIGIIGRLKNPGVKETLKALVAYLTHLKHDFVVETDTAESLADHSVRTVSRDQLGNHCQLLIVVGGDGSLLSAAHAVVDKEIPVLGINRGSLGFLTDIRPTDLEKIKAILAGEFSLEKRFLLSATVMADGKQVGQDNALNEVALIPGSVPHMVEFEIYVNDQFVCSQSSDGLVVTTPTGSTAYALSAGGPILHPQLDAIAIVPICAHTLSARPIVVEGNSRIKIVIAHDNVSSPRVSCDGQDHIQVPIGGHYTISKKPEPLHLVHPLEYNYFETLRSKLHWGKKLQNTE